MADVTFPTLNRDLILRDNETAALEDKVAKMAVERAARTPTPSTGPAPSDPLADAVRALKIAEMALELNLAGVKERRAEIKERKAEVVRLFFEVTGKKPRARKAAAK